jgi:maleylacetate reductase
VLGPFYVEGPPEIKEALVVDYVPRNGPAPGGRRVDGEWRSLEFTFRIAGHRPAESSEE